MLDCLEYIDNLNAIKLLCNTSTQKSIMNYICIVFRIPRKMLSRIWYNFYEFTYLMNKIIKICRYCLGKGEKESVQDLPLKHLFYIKRLGLLDIRLSYLSLILDLKNSTKPQFFKLTQNILIPVIFSKFCK